MAIKRFGWLAVHVALLGSLALVVTLSVQNRSLRAEYRSFIERTTLPHPGIYVPALETTTLTGEHVTVGEAPDGGSQLLFFFTTTCPYCRASLPAWKQLVADAAKLPNTSVLGIALDSVHLTEEYVREHELGFPVATSLDPKLGALYRVRRVPLTLVVKGDGRVYYAKTGEFSDQAAGDSVLTVLATPPVETGSASPPLSVQGTQ